MHERARAFVERAREEYGFEPSVREFPDGTKTAADAAAAIGCDVGQIASSLAFDVGEARNSPENRTASDDDDGLVVAVTSGANRVSEAALAAHFDTTADAVSMAPPDRIKSTLGWSIGGVPPFCHDAAVPVVFDETLRSYERVWAAAGTPTTVFPIDPDELVELADATVASFDE